MATFKEAHARLFQNVYVCHKTKRKVRMARSKILTGKFSTRRGISKSLRPKRMISKK